MESLLRSVKRVSWSHIEDSGGPAATIPALLYMVAWGNAAAAESAVGDLRERICRHDCLVHEATAVTVPFLWELAQAPHVTCRVEVLDLLTDIYRARQWECVATALPEPGGFDGQLRWEHEARAAVRAGQDIARQLQDERSAQLAEAASRLTRALTAPTAPGAPRL